MNNIIIKLVVEKPEVVVDLKIDKPSIKYSELINNMFKGERGLQGERGEQGNGIESIVKSSSDGLVDIYTILFTNGKTQTFNITNGADGKDGLNGKDGADGKDATIVGLTVNVDNTTGTPRATATMGGTPNERTFIINFSGLKGEQGKDGVIGRDGKSAYDYALEGGYIGLEQDFSKELSDIATKEFVEENSSNFITKNSKDLTNYTLTTETGSKLNLSINNDYLMTLQLLDKNGNVIDTKTLDFPIESMVVNASYSNGIITLVLQNGTELPINVSALVKGLVPDTRKINGKELNQDINLNAEDVGVPEWARENTKPKYDYSEIENTPNIPQGSTVDTELSTTSTNAVQNKVVTSAINNISSNLQSTTSKVNNNEETLSAISQNMNLLNINKANKDASNLDEINALSWQEKLGINSIVDNFNSELNNKANKSQWVNVEKLITGQSNMTVDLSSILPDDTTNYEILFHTYSWGSTGTWVASVVRVNTPALTNDICIAGSRTYANSTEAFVVGSTTIPVLGSNRKITIKPEYIGNGGYRILGYRRVY